MTRTAIGVEFVEIFLDNDLTSNTVCLVLVLVMTHMLHGGRGCRALMLAVRSYRSPAELER